MILVQTFVNRWGASTAENQTDEMPVIPIVCCHLLVVTNINIFMGAKLLYILFDECENN